MSLKSAVKKDFFIDEPTRNKLKAYAQANLSIPTENEPGSAITYKTQDDKIYVIVVCSNEQTKAVDYYAYEPQEKETNLGKGGAGQVVAGQNVDSGEVVALKIHFDTMTAFEDTRREQRNLLKAQYLLGRAIHESNEMLSVMTYFRGYSLQESLYKINPDFTKEDPAYFESKLALEFVKKLEFITLAIDAVIWLHEELELIHRDIKPENFILVEQPNGTILKLVDLGNALNNSSLDKEKTKSLVGTFGYFAPEMLLPLAKRPFYNYASDMFSLGIVLAEILTCTNYQRSLVEHRLKQRTSDTLGELSLSDIKAFMPDVFFLDIPVTESDENREAWKKLSQLIFLLTQEDLLNRPNSQQLKQWNLEIKLMLQKLKYMTLTSTTSPRDRIQHRIDLKRRNSTLLPRRQSYPPLPTAQEKEPDVEIVGAEMSPVRTKVLRYAHQYDLLKNPQTEELRRQKYQPQPEETQIASIGDIAKKKSLKFLFKK